MAQKRAKAPTPKHDTAFPLTFSNTPPDKVFWNLAQHELGPLMLGFTQDGALCRLAFLEKRKPAAELKQWQKQWPDTHFQQAAKLRKLQPSAPLFMTGTDFQHRVWAALMEVEAGQPLTYGELASRIGKPNAARAVGAALGANPVPLVVPCHRIVASNSIGGFTGNLAIKRALLNREALSSVTAQRF